MLLTNFCSCLAAAAFLCSSASHSDSNATVSPPTPFSITLHVPNAPGHDYFELDNSSSSFDVIIKNITSVPQKVWGDRFPPGYDALTLHITAINGQVLSMPVGISKRPRAWAANAPYTVTVYPGQEVEQRIYVSDLPAYFLVIPNEANKKLLPIHDHRLTSGPRLPRLSGTNSSRFEAITAYATFNTRNDRNAPAGKAFNSRYGVWSGQVTSAPITFKTGR